MGRPLSRRGEFITSLKAPINYNLVFVYRRRRSRRNWQNQQVAFRKGRISKISSNLNPRFNISFRRFQTFGNLMQPQSGFQSQASLRQVGDVAGGWGEAECFPPKQAPHFPLKRPPKREKNKTRLRCAQRLPSFEPFFPAPHSIKCCFPRKTSQPRGG